MSMTPSDLAALLTEPALQPPTGVKANFDNPPNKNGLAIFVTTFCMIVATIAVFVRTYAKLGIMKKIHIEEVMMLCAYGAYCTTAYAAYKMIKTPGYYVHEWNMRSKDLVEPLYLILIYGCAYSATLALIKIAILIDWCRIFVPGDGHKSAFWLGSMFIIFVQLSWGIACIILLNMQCVPHAAIWKFYLPSKCYSASKVMLTSASVQVFSDWTMVLLPQKVIWSLRMNWQKKVGVSIIFGVGLLASISASLRLSTTITFAKQADEMYYIAPLLFWACAEMTCGFFIFCVPCVATVIKESRLPSKIRNVLGSSIKSSNSPSNLNSKDLNNTNHLASHKRSKVGSKANDAYYNIEDEDGGLALYALKSSESQEHLQTQQGNETLKVMRTTHTIVTSDSHSAKSDNDVEALNMPWAR